MEKSLAFIREIINSRFERRIYCKSCDILREELAQERKEKRALLDRFVFKEVPQSAIINDTPQPITSRVVPWKIQRELLEAEDRAKAATIRRAREEQEKLKLDEVSVAQLEKELGLNDAG